jgi:hypothetical protein
MYKHLIYYTLIILALFIIVTITAHNHGVGNRIYAISNTTLVVDAPQKAYFIWKDMKVRGRILILFDNYPHTLGYYAYNDLPQLTQSNLVEFSIFENIIRKIYFVVPENKWTEFRNQKFAKPIMEFDRTLKGIYLYNQAGIPIIALPPSSLPRLNEKTLVYINDHVVTTEQALAILDEKKISSDIIVSYKRIKK